MEFNTFLEQLKSKINIVDVAMQYITLTKKGSKYWGCCPFHHETAPSFAIDEIKQFYYCFGCHESGDVIKFVQKIESTDFMGAATILAKRAGIEVPTFSGRNSDELEIKKKKRERVYALLKDSAIFYNKNLYLSSQKEKLNYLYNRGISNSTITKFGMGASTDFNSIVNHLEKLGYTKDEMVEAGVCGSKDGRVYDAYANRVIIPIIDSFGQVVAFGGRTLDKNVQGKYKNTGDTIAFNKRKILYGLNLIKKTKQKEKVNSIILVEGYMDAISVYEAGFKNVVASMGTAFTKEQAKLIHYMVEEVYVCYDGDSAGIKGAILAQKILEEEGINAKIIILRDKLDPDDMIKKYGVNEFQKALDNAYTGTQFKFKIMEDSFNILDPYGKKKYIEKALKLISEMTTEAEKEEWLKFTSKKVNISIDSLKKDLTKVEKGEIVEVEIEKSVDSEDFSLMGIRFLLNCCIEGRKGINDIAIIENTITNETHRRIFKYLKEKDGKIMASMLFEILDESEYEELTKILNFREDNGIAEENIETYFSDCILKQEKEELEENIKRLNSIYKETGDLEEKKKILVEINDLSKKLKKGA